MNERLNTRGLAELLANQIGMDKKGAEEFIDALALYIAQSLERNKVVKIFGFGVFKILLVRKRESIHIQTGERFVIPAHHKITFTPDKEFKEQINRPFALFEPIEATESEILAFNKQAKKTTLTPEVPETDFQSADKEYPLSESHTTDNNFPFEEETIEQTDFSNESSVRENNFESDFDTEKASLELQSPNENISYQKPYELQLLDDDSISVVPVLKQDNDGSPSGKSESNEIDNRSLSSDKKNKRRKAGIWVFSAFALIAIFIGSRSGTYLFLQRSTDKTAKIDNSQDISSTYYSNSDFPSPLGSASTPDDELINNSFLPEDTQGDTQNDGRTAENSASESNALSQQTENIDRIWSMPSPENSRSEVRRAEKPNQEIEAKNRTLANNVKQAQSRNTEETTNRNTPPATAPATQVSTTPTPAASSNARSMPTNIKMPAGSSLRQLALEYYGDKIFWVYIYEHNKSRIKNFNNIPVDTELIIPESKTYGIDAKNATSVNRALQKQRELLR